MFPVGPSGRRALRKALVTSTDPVHTIQTHQQSHSLHAMMARAFDTTPTTGESKEKDDTTTTTTTTTTNNKETLDPNSVLTFLSHLGVSQYEVHKRISDALKTQLEDQVRSKASRDDLLNLLKSCWPYSTVIPELRSVLCTILKELGTQTPLPVLERLAERTTTNGKKLKHEDLWRSLPPLIKRLVWEADWDHHYMLVPQLETTTTTIQQDPKELLKSMENATLLGEMVGPLIDEYCTGDTSLVEAADLVFVGTTRERRVATSQRRVRTVSTSTTAAAASVSSSKAIIVPSPQKGRNNTGQSSSSFGEESSMTISKLQYILGGRADETSSTAATSSLQYRPKLLSAILSMLMARHASRDMALLGGASFLHCTLVSDLLLSAGSGALPKPYQDLLALTRALDDAVKVGYLSDSAIASIQACLKRIFQAPQDATTKDSFESPTAGNKTTNKKQPDNTKKVQKVLKRIIHAALDAMKESDPRSLFLNPVTDSIAPGYSAVIKKPMCIKTMEQKQLSQDNYYETLEEWHADVQLMFSNCITYNIGNEGQWFRGEARRQNKIFKEDIYPQAKKLVQNEVSKLKSSSSKNTAGGDAAAGPKRKFDLMTKDDDSEEQQNVEPLPASVSKKRKKDSEDDVPSIPTLATMVLADPFVVRLLLQRILQSLRVDVLKATTLPTAHGIFPSLLQLVHMAQWSTELCKVRGKRYFVPDVGLTVLSPQDTRTDSTTSAGAVPFMTLRKYTPLLVQLLLESELDRRMAVGADLHAVAQSFPKHQIYSALTTTKGVAIWSDDTSYLFVLRALVEGALVHACQPGNSSDGSLAVTFSKYAQVLQHLSSDLWKERPFFVSLIHALLRHKSKLNRNVRDVVVKTWLEWFQIIIKDDKEGAMMSPLHECMLVLLNEWAALGNILLPRDMLLQFSNDAAVAANASEHLDKRKISYLWENSEENPGFIPVKQQYLRMLQSVPETHATQWKEKLEIGGSSSDVDSKK